MPAPTLAGPVREYVGSGPFRFLRHEWVPGSKAAYARWEKYLPIEGAPDFTSGGKIAHFDRVEWIVLPDPATAAAALQQGVVDWVQLPLLDLLPVLRDAAGVRVAVNDGIGVIPMLALNHLHPPFDNPLLRRALLPAVAQPAFVQAAVGSEQGLIGTSGRRVHPRPADGQRRRAGGARRPARPGADPPPGRPKAAITARSSCCCRPPTSLPCRRCARSRATCSSRPG